jgi:glycosyltransferase involved in cell wall biosynthesis
VKILQVNVTFTPVAGGTTTVMRQLSEALLRMGHKVTIYAGDFKFDREYVSRMQGVKVHTFHSWLSLSRFYLMPGMIGQVRRTLKDFDIVHLHSLRSFPSIVVRHYARKYSLPYVLQAHGSATTYFQKGMLKRIFDKLWGYGILRDAAKVIALTQTEAEQYKSMRVKEDKIEIVPNGIDPSEFENLPQRGEFRRKYGLDDNQRIVLYLGRIHQTKGIDLLARAFVTLSKEVSGAKLVIVGPDDGYLPALKRLIKELHIEEEVLLTGPVYGRDKLGAYIDADVFVTPSFYGFPVTFMEACATGTPIVTTERGDHLDWLDGQIGYVTPYDEKELAKRITTILGNKGLAEQFGSNGRQIVKDQFNWSSIAERMERIYASAQKGAAA